MAETWANGRLSCISVVLMPCPNVCCVCFLYTMAIFLMVLGLMMVDDGREFINVSLFALESVRFCKIYCNRGLICKITHNQWWSFPHWGRDKKPTVLFEILTLQIFPNKTISSDGCANFVIVVYYLIKLIFTAQHAGQAEKPRQLADLQQGRTAAVTVFVCCGSVQAVKMY